MKKAIDILGLVAIVVTAFIATAGSINYGCANHEHIYTVFGALNFAGWAFIAYKWMKQREMI